MEKLFVDIHVELLSRRTAPPWTSEFLVINEFHVTDSKFIYNSGAKLSEYDLFQVTLREDDCSEFFLLRTGLKRIPDQIVLDYCWKQIRKYSYKSNQYDPLGLLKTDY